MTATDWQKLKQDAAETMQSIDAGKLTKDKYVLYGASLAILDHATAPPIHTSKSFRELVEDELSDAEMYAVMGEYEIARDELRHADRFLAILKTQPDKASSKELIERRNMVAEKIVPSESSPYHPENMAFINARMNLIDFVPQSKIDELKQESLMMFVKYMNEKALEKTEDSALHGERAENALKRMLKVDEGIAEMLFKFSDDGERRLIRESFYKYAQLVD